jgi:hypothetical protein
VITRLAADSRFNSAAEVVLRSGEPGLFLNQLVSNRTDVAGLVGPLMGVPAGVKPGVWLHPMGLAGKGRTAFRASLGGLGLTAGETCAALGPLDGMQIREDPADLFVFEKGKGGEAEGAWRCPSLRWGGR